MDIGFAVITQREFEDNATRRPQLLAEKGVPMAGNVFDKNYTVKIKSEKTLGDWPDIVYRYTWSRNIVRENRTNTR